MDLLENLFFRCKASGEEAEDKRECFESEDKLWDFMHMEMEQHY